ncbi:MAG: ArsR family transcriptional regulator, arsenate/arsenite/antimonite-responsive transcriptional [Actinomycetota bacterium]|jgi:protein-tyrosine-phosphatase/DNA-binding HxlR family transcriptional regulator|nr:ArsR family transcriptional regulator, arsenate/arsenite/antimonite-responsive transcriptional [Actinomycetota bacterium]
MKGAPVARDRGERSRVFAALGDAHRLGVVDLLQVQDLSPDALAAALEIPGNLLAHHLKVLESAGVITRTHSQNDRRRIYVQLVDDALEGLLPQPSTMAAGRVVFVCTHNSARSVLAEALWRDASDVPTTSAGTHPAERFNPSAIAAAERLGLTVAARPPQSIDDVLQPDDVVVSVCDSVNEELGELPNRRFHWSVPDPARVGTDAAFAGAVDDLRARVAHLAPRVRYRRHDIRSAR